jgi:hypothetical protein
MRTIVTALLAAVATAVCAGCVTGPEGARFAGSAGIGDSPASAVSGASVGCEHSGGWYDHAAGVCDGPGE